MATEQEQVKEERKILVSEIFGPTLQGEGAVIGMQTMFLRLGGCDYRCTKCDSLHAVLPELIKKNSTPMTHDEIYDKLTSIAGHCRMLTLSGGNPVMWELLPLIMRLHRERWKVAVETQGTLWRQWVGLCDYITVSPKGPGMGEKFEPEKFKRFVHNAFYSIPPSLYNVDREVTLKIVIFDQQDIEFAKELHLEYPTLPMYLSLGNPNPPIPGVDNTPQDHNELCDGKYYFKGELLDRMALLYEDISKEPILHDTIFLPQMHVLLWGNEKGR